MTSAEEMAARYWRRRLENMRGRETKAMNRSEGEVLEQEGLTDDQSAHLGRVTRDHVALIQLKYAKGQVEHGGNCWEKPGMLAHALDEAADLPVYLQTLREQMLTLAAKCRQDGITLDAVADEIERWLHK